MKVRCPILFLILALLLAACGGSAPQAQTQPAPAGLPSGLLASPQAPAETALPAPAATTAPAQPPLQIAVTLDERAAVEAEIPLEGGQLVLDAPGGAKYTLEIPAGALLEAVTVRMTAVQQVSGLPFGAPHSYAVDLEPEGLVFYQPAILTIETPEAIPLDEQIFFGYQQQGAQVFLALPVVGSREMKMALLHFSGYGVTRGMLADIEPVRARLGGSDEVRLQSQIAEVLQQERQRIQKEGEGASETALHELTAPLFQAYYDLVVAPRIAAAGESCAAGRLAVQTAIAYLRSMALLGGEEALDRIDLAGLLDTATRVCLDEEYQLCAEQHIIHRMIPLWISTMRQSQLLGASTPESPSALEQYAQSLTEKCLTFELAFESTGKSFDGSVGFDGGVSASVPLMFDASEMKISGSGVLVNEYANFYADDCTVNYTAGNGTFEVFELYYSTGEEQAPPAGTQPAQEQLGQVTKLGMEYFPGVTSGTISITCEEGGGGMVGDGSTWFATFLLTHMDEYIAGERGMVYPANDWTIHGGELFAERSWQREDASLESSEQGTMQLYHRPGR